MMTVPSLPQEYANVSDGIVIRHLQGMAELRATVPLQRAIWGMQDVELASPHTLRAVAHAGGAVIAALAQGRMVGFCFAMAAWRERELWLWSHMAGVHPAFQGRGIGYRLKQAQREWALDQGFRRMAWTFDPLQSGNANFNFNRLGVYAQHYSVDHYGAMEDGINAGLASDRLEACWQLDAPRALALARGQPASAEAPTELPALLFVDAQGQLQQRRAPSFDAAAYSIDIPPDIAVLKQRDLPRAQSWQRLLRTSMTALLQAGYVVTGFQRAGGRYSYRLTRAEPQAPGKH